MRRLFTTVFSLLFLILILAPAIAADEGRYPGKDRYWRNLDEDRRFTLQTTDGFTIYGRFYTEEDLRQFYGSRWSRNRREGLDNLRTFKIKWPERTILKLIVEPREGGFFEPRKLSFTQWGKTYEVREDVDLHVFNDEPREVWLTREETLQVFIAIPNEIVLARQFTLGYGNAEVDIEGVEEQEEG